MEKLRQMVLTFSSIPKSFAWTFVFAPALAFFLSTTVLSQGLWSELGTTFPTKFTLPGSITSCETIANVFNVVCHRSIEDTTTSVQAQLRYSWQQVLSPKDGIGNISDLQWRHDSEMGRGYLLISDSRGVGRIWRWEVGGGPIAIGKTLHLDDAGCRNVNKHGDACKDKVNAGAGAMTIDFSSSSDQQNSNEGLLVLSEQGQGRIVRLDENGARTPLLMHTPVCCSDTEKQDVSTCPLPTPQNIVLAPSGTLYVSVNIFCEDTGNQAKLVELPNAVHVEALPSLAESRRAHEWSSVQHNFSATTTRLPILNGSKLLKIGGLVAAPSSLYATVLVSKNYRDEDATNDGRVDSSNVVLLVKHSTANDDDEQISLDGNHASKVIADISKFTKDPGVVAVSAANRIFTAVKGGILILAEDEKETFHVVDRLSVPESPIVALTLGGDGHLYVAGSQSLYRIRTKEKPLGLSTDHIKKPLSAV